MCAHGQQTHSHSHRHSVVRVLTNVSRPTRRVGFVRTSQRPNIITARERTGYKKREQLLEPLAAGGIPFESPIRCTRKVSAADPPLFKTATKLVTLLYLCPAETLRVRGIRISKTETFPRGLAISSWVLLSSFKRLTISRLLLSFLTILLLKFYISYVQNGRKFENSKFPARFLDIFQKRLNCSIFEIQYGHKNPRQFYKKWSLIPHFIASFTDFISLLFICFPTLFL